MAAVSGVRGGHGGWAGGLHNVPGNADVVMGIGGPDTGDGSAGGFGQVGEPVRPGVASSRA